MSRQSFKFQSMVVALGLAVLGALLTLACQQGSSPTAPAFEQPAVQSVTGAASAGKALVCHQGTNGPETLEVSLNAVQAHLAHGDTEGACGAAAVCPCYTSGDLDEAGFDPALAPSCTNSPNGGAIGGEVSILQIDPFTFQVVFVQNLSDGTDGLTCSLTSTGASATGLSLDEWNACNDLVLAKIDELGLTCSSV